MTAASPSTPQLDTSQSTSDPARVDWLAEFPPPRSLPLDREALRIYEHAYALGLAVEERRTPPITFTTVLTALFAGLDDSSRWFREQATRHGPEAPLVLAEKQTDLASVHARRPAVPGRPADLRLSDDKHLLTASSRSVLGIAEGWAQKVRGSEIGVRHLVAAYVLNPPAAHRQQMQDWKFQQPAWRKVFFEWVAERYTAEQWTDASYRAAPAQAIPEIERLEVKGASLAFPGDVHSRAVLQRAAELHARRPDDWLRVQTLWHALIERRDDPTLESALEPVAAAVAKAGPQYVDARAAFLPESASEREVVAFDALDISPRVLNALETARELAVATQMDAASEVSILHLAGALVSRRVDCDPELIAFGIDPEALRSRMIEHAEALGQPELAWRDAIGVQETTEAGRPVELNSDEPGAVIRGDTSWADDPLQIRRDVETFASLLASRSLEPPLSIGLFGPWGSGKTTFLKRLRLAVERRAKEAQDAIGAGRPTAYAANVVHVDFNAWHYAEGALTSSLVDTILRRLGDYITNREPNAGKQWERRKVDALESTKRKVEAAKAVLAAADALVTSAETELRAKQTVAEEAAASVRGVALAMWSATRATFTAGSKEHELLASLGGTVSSGEELRARIETLRSRPARMLREMGWVGTLVIAVLAIGVPLLATWIARKFFPTQPWLHVVSAGSGVVSVLGVWARTASAAVTRADQAMQRIETAYSEQIAKNEGLGQAQSALVAARASAAMAATNLQAAHDELARVRVDAANATLPAQMLQLVNSRLDAQAYDKELTTTSLARADLEALSALLRDEREAPSSGRTSADIAQEVANTVATATLKRVERVILYIDDLDRCKPQDVVRVLQLVHMLLAFELFAVVVAVDARWVEESLHQSYQWLSPDAGDVAGASTGRGVADHITPQDYLEKIFQIAFWLTPMTAQRAAHYLKSLVRVQARPAATVAAAASSATEGTPTVPAAVSVEIDVIELDYMRYLAAYVGTSPRRVKRLVNAYRLIKANLTDPQLATFLTRFSRDEGGRPLSGPYQLVIGLLAIGTGAPASAARIFRDIAASDSTAAPDDVVHRFRKADHPDWTMAAQVIEVVLRTQKAKDIRELRDWTAIVGRFLLRSPLDRRIERTESVREWGSGGG